MLPAGGHAQDPFLQRYTSVPPTDRALDVPAPRVKIDPSMGNLFSEDVLPHSHVALGYDGGQDVYGKSHQTGHRLLVRAS